jgi:hypothetical protein
MIGQDVNYGLFCVEINVSLDSILSLSTAAIGRATHVWLCLVLACNLWLDMNPQVYRWIFCWQDVPSNVAVP